MNGNQLKDDNKSLNILEYNHINLPLKIDLGNDITIEYLYSAGGTKLRQKTFNNGTLQEELDYCGNFVYENSSLKYILTSDGRLLPCKYRLKIKINFPNIRKRMPYRRLNYVIDILGKHRILTSKNQVKYKWSSYKEK